MVGTRVYSTHLNCVQVRGEIFRGADKTQEPVSATARGRRGHFRSAPFQRLKPQRNPANQPRSSCTLRLTQKHVAIRQFWATPVTTSMLTKGNC